MIDEVRYERVGAAAVLTIDRQHRRNAVDGPTAERLRDGVPGFEADDDARVLVISGAGGEAFCAGADLKAIESFAPRLTDPGGPLGFTRLTPSKPTIAAIDGWCAGRRPRAGALVRPADRRPRARGSASPSGAGACR